MSFLPEGYQRYTYPKVFDNVLVQSFWARFLCPRNWHLWDEVLTGCDHYLVCDGCGVMFGSVDNMDEPLSAEEVERQIVEWCDQTFGASVNPLAKARHLAEEVEEIREELLKKRRSKVRLANEIADVQIILWHLGKIVGISPAGASYKKWAGKLVHRRWHPPDKNGVIRHVKGT